MSTPEGRDQVPENLTPEGRAIVQRLDAVIAALNSFSQNQAEVNEAVSARLQQGEERLDIHDAFMADSRAHLQDSAERLANQESMLAELKEINAATQVRIQQGEERLKKSDLHLGYLRGTHAANAAKRDADVIADDMGYQLVDLVPREMLIGFVNMARAAGKPENDVRSFREADLIMLVRDSQGQPAYISVEASFTVAANDIERARRNAEYLHEFTGLPARGAVAGVDITSGQRRNASAAAVHCYTIPVKDLEAD